MRAIDRAVERAGGQQKLADLVGVSQGRVSQWCKGEPIPIEHFPKIKAATGVSVHKLLDDELRKLEEKGEAKASGTR